MKELLKQYNDLCKEIIDLKSDIDRLERKEYAVERDSVRGSNPCFPYEPRNFKIEGYNIIEEEEINNKIYRRKNVLYKRKVKCEELKLKIEEFISNIPDSKTRRVFKYRYIDKLSWQAIASKIGKAHESYPRKEIHDKYLNNL